MWRTITLHNHEMNLILVYLNIREIELSKHASYIRIEGRFTDNYTLLVLYDAFHNTKTVNGRM